MIRIKEMDIDQENCVTSVNHLILNRKNPVDTSFDR